MKAAFGGLVGAAAIAATVAGTVWAGHKRDSGATVKGGTGKPAPVVVELFTSEGCSSCPPADAVLARLEQSQTVPIIALGFHVDYWNRLGWADPFSTKQFTDRQGEYAQAFKNDQVYTPQMVVDGKTEFVGSEEKQAGQAITAAARQPKTSVALVVNAGANGAKTIRASVAPLPPFVRAGDVFVALTESGLSSQVMRGENSGRHLAHAAVVRLLVSLGTVGPKGGDAVGSVSATSGSRPENLRVVVFVQDKATHRIVGAAQTGF